MADALKEALSRLDPANDEHWTSDGSPAVKAVEAIMNGSTNRAAITAADPELTREVAAARAAPPPPVEGESTETETAAPLPVEGASGEDTLAAADPATVEGLAADDADKVETDSEGVLVDAGLPFVHGTPPVDANGEAPATQDLTPGPDVPAQKAEEPATPADFSLEEAQARLEEANEELARLGRLRDELNAAIDRAQVARDAIVTAISRDNDFHNDAVQAYFAREDAARRDRAEQVQLIRALVRGDLPEGVGGTALDQAMAARRGFGLTRPSFVPPAR